MQSVSLSEEDEALLASATPFLNLTLFNVSSAKELYVREIVNRFDDIDHPVETLNVVTKVRN